MARLGRARRGPVSALAPSARLLGLLLSSAAVFFMGPRGSGPLSLALLCLLIAEGQKPRALLRDALFVLSLAGATLLIEGLSFEAGPRLDFARLLPGAARDALRLAASFEAGRLFYTTTRSSELREAAEDSCRLLPGSLGSEIGLSLLLVLSFLPLILDEWRASLLAARARGLPRRPGLKASAELLSSFLRRLMLRSLALPEALAARGWTGGAEGRGRPARRPWAAYDYIAIAVSGVCLLGLLRL